MAAIFYMALAKLLHKHSIITLILIFMVSLLCIWILLPVILDLRVSTPDFAASTNTPLVGEEIIINIKQEFRMSGDVKRIEAHLALKEEASGLSEIGLNRRRSYRHYQHERIMSVDAIPGFQVASGETFQGEFRLKVPDDATHTFHSGHNSITWFICFEVEMKNWPLFRRLYPLQVLAEKV